MVNNLPEMKETQVQPLGLEDPMEKGMATHSRINCLEKSMDSGYSPWGHSELFITEQLTLLSEGSYTYIQKEKMIKRLF